MEDTSMSEEFYEWLNECPASWTRISDDGEGNCEYSFNQEKEDE